MWFLFASDSFKGSLTSAQTAQLLTRAAEELYRQAARRLFCMIAEGNLPEGKRL